MISKNRVVSHMIMVLSKIDGKKSVYSYLILNPNTNEQVEVHSDAKGDVTELRAYELRNNGYDKDATELKFGSKKLCVFDKIAYSIQPFQMVKEEVLALVKKHNLSKSEVDLKKLDD